MSTSYPPTPKAPSRLTAWFQRFFASLKRLFGGAPVQSDGSIADAPPQMWQTPPAERATLDAANSLAYSSWEHPNPQARLTPECSNERSNTGSFGPSEKTPPYTPRSLAAHVSRPLDAAQGYAGLPARQDLPSSSMPPAPPTLPDYPRPLHAQDEDTLPPREFRSTYPPSDPDAPTLPRLDLSQNNLPAPSEFADGQAPTPLTPPEERSLNPIDVSTSTGSSGGLDTGAASYADGADDEQEDAAQRDERALAEATAGSPIARRRLLFLRYLVRRNVYNEGFSAGQAPQQYHRSLGMDDDTLPGE